MSSKETILELNTLRREFYTVDTTEERQIEILTRVQELAEIDKDYNPHLARCSHCKQMVIACPHDKALIPGHIYSTAGERELEISRLCEYCFDEITKEPDEEPDDYPTE